MNNYILVKVSDLSIETMQAVWRALRKRVKMEKARLFRLEKEGCYKEPFLHQVRSELGAAMKEMARCGLYIRKHHPIRWDEMVEEAALLDEKEHKELFRHEDGHGQTQNDDGGISVQSTNGFHHASAAREVQEQEVDDPRVLICSRNPPSTSFPTVKQNEPMVENTNYGEQWWER